MKMISRNQTITEELKALDDMIEKLVIERDVYRSELALLLCPFSLDQKVINKQGEKAVVTTISWSSFSEKYKMKVTRIKKNGELYLGDQRVWSRDEWSACDE